MIDNDLKSFSPTKIDVACQYFQCKSFEKKENKKYREKVKKKVKKKNAKRDRRKRMRSCLI